jgi:hypothetical protein
VAALSDHPAAVGALLAAGADPSLLDRNAESALHKAVHSAAEVIAQPLPVSDLDAMNDEGRTAEVISTLVYGNRSAALFSQERARREREAIEKAVGALPASASPALREEDEAAPRAALAPRRV